MTESNSQSGLIGRRSELMAELFLQELNPKFLARPTEDFGFDFLVTFKNPKGGLNTYGVEVKGTIPSHDSFECAGISSCGQR